MKVICKDIITALLMGLVLPSVLLNVTASLFEEQSAILPELTVQSAAAQAPPATEAAVQPERTMELLLSDGSVTELSMTDYLTGVLLGEMPADFEVEALKAQAVAARTYTEKVRSWGGKHGEGRVCAEPGCCQAYLSQEAYLKRGGTVEALQKVRSAVEATANEVLTYDGELIEAVYFSCSGGATEDAAAVWGSDIPYLRSVESPGEENAAHDTDTVTFTSEVFRAALGQPLSGDPETWFGDVTYTAGGGVDTMTIGGLRYSGTALRTQLALRSTNFTVEVSGDVITITTHGWGHRVGMSQYGADAMAVLGSGYREILAHYYPGTVLTTWPY